MTYQAMGVAGWARHDGVARSACGCIMAANKTGLRAIGAPAGHDSAGLPIGVQLAMPPVHVSSKQGR